MDNNVTTICKYCGSNQIELNQENGKLYCNYCKKEYLVEPKIFVEEDESLKKISGKKISHGAMNIKNKSDNIIIVKCHNCAASIVIDISNNQLIKCHWCHSILKIDSKIGNGYIPDLILPFKITKEYAKKEIDFYLKEYKFIDKTFKKSINLDNIVGVYFPYMLVDGNCEMKLEGTGEHTKKVHINNENERYDIEIFKVLRDFDIEIYDLPIESNKEISDKKNQNISNNIIETIMPFDTEQCVEYDSRYLIGYTSEKRDLNVNDLEKVSNLKMKDIAKNEINKSLTFYDRGLHWNEENFNVKGSNWNLVYLPIWIYSYKDERNNKIHYIAINGRTGKINGSIPISKIKITLYTLYYGTIGALIFSLIFTPFYFEKDNFFVSHRIIQIIMIIYSYVSAFVVIFRNHYKKYLKKGDRYNYESNTKAIISNITEKDIFLDEKKVGRKIIKNKNNDKYEGFK